MKVIYGSCFEQGVGRRKNQDSMIFKSGSVFKSKIYAAAVCDGVGALAGSEYASGLVTKYISEWFDNIIELYNKNKKNSRVIYSGLKNSLREKLWLAHKTVCEETENLDFEAATTVCAMFFADNQYCIYSTGDSRIFELDSKGMKQLTVDQVADFNGRSVLSNCLGCFPGPDFKVTEGRAKKNTAYLLSTDGFYRRLDYDEITRRISKAKTNSEIEQVLKDMRGFNLMAGETDDSSVIAVKFM